MQKLEAGTRTSRRHLYSLHLEGQLLTFRPLHLRLYLKGTQRLSSGPEPLLSFPFSSSEAHAVGSGGYLTLLHFCTLAYPESLFWTLFSM